MAIEIETLLAKRGWKNRCSLADLRNGFARTRRKWNAAFPTQKATVSPGDRSFVVIQRWQLFTIFAHL